MPRNARPLELKVVPIGNSRGVRLPKAILDKYAIRDAVIVEEREEGLLLRGKKDKRLSWEDTFKAMAQEREDWSDLDASLKDGLDQEPWWPAVSSVTASIWPTSIPPGAARSRRPSPWSW